MRGSHEAETGAALSGDTADEHCGQPSSWALVQAVQRGDSDAFGQLYVRYASEVHAYVLAQTREWPLSEDLTSETFLRALRGIQDVTYQGKDFVAWLKVIARNIITDHRKSAAQRYEHILDSLEDAAATAPNPSDIVLNQLLADELWAYVHELPQAQRDCLLLRFVDELSVGETAHVLRRNKPAVKALQYRAIRKLADTVSVATTC